jgi:putative membrane protein
MVTALFTSTLFLISYVTYHYARGGQATLFTGEGIVRTIYFTILISHILLAFIILPLVIATLVPVFRRRWGKHAWLGRWTMPVWLYVSVTGVLVYLMLYRWFPAAAA